MPEKLTEAVNVVRAYCDAWMAGDTMAVVALYHDDLTLEWPGDHRFAGIHTGQHASINALLELQAATNRVPTRIGELLTGPASVIVVVDERWTSPTDPHQILEHTRALEYTVEDGKLRTCRVFETQQVAIELWLTETPLDLRQSDAKRD